MRLHSSFAEVQLTLHIADANPRLETCVEKERGAHIHENHCNHNADLEVRSSARSMYQFPLPEHAMLEFSHES